jgi:SAM-dependent methyltransferase
MHGESADVTWTHPFLDAVVHFLPGDTRLVVDVGCGRGIGGVLCRLYRSPAKLIGLDAFRPYLAFVRGLHVYSDLVRFDFSRNPRLPFRRITFDVGLVLEFIEHIPKDRGEALLEDLMANCTRLIVSTPNEFFPQDHYDGNPFQRHLSAWHVRDFERMGFDVYGVGGLRGAGRNIGYALGRLTSVFPRASTHLLAVWDRRGQVSPLLHPHTPPGSGA